MSAPTIQLSVAYPQGAKFDMAYYLSTHMPLVQKHWASFGLKSWRVSQYDGDDSPYGVQAWLEWETADGMAKGTSDPEAAAAIFGDIANFTDGKPVILKGELKGSWQA